MYKENFENSNAYAGGEEPATGGKIQFRNADVDKANEQQDEAKVVVSLRHEVNILGFCP